VNSCGRGGDVGRQRPFASRNGRVRVEVFEYVHVVPIVVRALVGVREEAVGVANLFEAPLGRLLPVGVLVGVPLERLAPVRLVKG